MNAEDLKKIIEQEAIEQGGKKRLPCALAFEIAERHGVALREIGESCNRNGIKIVGCQLGCFE